MKEKEMANEYGRGDTSWFTRERLGMFIHWGTYALGARHEWLKHREEMTDERYQRYFDHFYPDLYDPKEWARMAKAAGMRYFVITTKHHEGFCLWDTKYTDYKATNTPWGKDLLRPMVDAFRAEGIRVGFYYSLIDWHHPEFPVDRIHPRRNDQEYRKQHANRDVSKYAEYMRNQVTELLTSFGEIDVLWFDFSYPGEDGKGRNDWESEKLIEVVRKHQPSIIVDNRLDLPGSGDIVTPEQFQPQAEMTDEEGRPVVWEACQTFSGSWGYHRDEMTWKSVPQLLWMLIDGVSKNGNLLLNVGPTARGEFDYRAVDRLSGMGEWMRRHGRSIYGCGAAPKELAAPTDCRYTYNAATKRLYLHVLAWPFKTIVLPGLEGRVSYAQLLHDGSEVFFKNETEFSDPHRPKPPKGSVVIDLPVVKPNVEIPVVELYLK
jgi:alpha-L-fucosidase